jgi:hypothetical protein
MPRKYLCGDIVGVETGGLLAQLNYLCIAPATKLYHFLVIGQYIEDEDDYVILESIGRGVTVGRLSWYGDKTYLVLRLEITDVEELGEKATLKSSKFGRRKYDFLLVAKFVVGALRCFARQLIREHRLHRIHYSKFPYLMNANLICTELPIAIWRLVGQRFIPKGYAPFPSAFIAALKAGRLKVVGVHSS